MAGLTGAPARVQAALVDLGVDSRIVVVPETTRTAVEAARTVGCEVGQIVKSLIFRTLETGRPVLVLASGANRVDERAVAALVGEALGKADAAFVKVASGFSIGGVAPVGHPAPILTYIDTDLLQYETVWAAAGSPFAIFPISPPELVRATGGVVLALAARE